MNKNLLNNTIFLAIVASTLWATAFVGIKIGLRYSAPLQFAGIRFFLSGLMIIPIIPNLREKLKAIPDSFGKIVLVGFIQTFLQYAVFYSGVNLVPGALGAMVIGAGPLFAVLVAHFFMPNDRLTLNRIVSVAIGLTGVVVISLGRNRIGGAGDLVGLGVVLLIANNIIAGFGNVIVARDGKNIPPLVLSSFSMIIGGIMLFLVGIAFEGYRSGPFPAEYFGALAWLSFLSAAAISIWYTLLKRPGIKVSELNMWKFIIPVLGAILSWIILPNEHPTLVAIVGMMLVGVALVILGLNGKIEKWRNRQG